MHRAKRRRHETQGAIPLTQAPVINGGTQHESQSEDDSSREVSVTAYHTPAWCILCLKYQDSFAAYNRQCVIWSVGSGCGLCIHLLAAHIDGSDQQQQTIDWPSEEPSQG